MPSHGTIAICSNDGAETLTYLEPSLLYGGTLTITGTGAEYVDDNYPSMNGTYVYNGSNTFLGLATSPNATTPTYGIGTAVDISSGGEHMSLYIVEEVKEATKPTITFDLTTLGLTGTHSITVRAKASGYADSAESEAVSYVVASAEITDLTGTTWFIPAGWTAASRYGAFSVDWTDQLLDYESDGDFWLGYNENEIWDAGFNNWWDNSTSLCPTFHRGEDVTNPSLISWLKEHGINVTGKTLITFTIDGTTYCAESGMTWGEWCESEYNTNARIGVKSTGYIGWDAEYEGDAHASVYGFTEQDYIVANDPITADGEYVVEASHTGGSNH